MRYCDSDGCTRKAVTLFIIPNNGKFCFCQVHSENNLPKARKKA